MRALFLSSILAVLMCLPFSVKAAGEAESLALQSQIFNKTLQDCLKEVYTMDSYGPEYGTSLIERCLESKGVNLRAFTSPVSTSAKMPQAYRMGKGAGDTGQARALTYQIENMDRFLDNIQGGAKAKPAAATPSEPKSAASAPQAQPEEERERRASPQSVREEKSSGDKSAPKYYLPSDKSGNGAKPIFLGR